MSIHVIGLGAIHGNFFALWGALVLKGFYCETTGFLFRLFYRLDDDGPGKRRGNG